MKNKNSIGGCWLLIISYWLLVECIPFSIFHLPSSIAAAEPDRNFKSKFLQIALNIPEDEKDKAARNELKRIIEQIRSINVELRKNTYEPVIVPDKVLIDEPNEVVEKDKDTKEQQKKEIESGPREGIIAKQTEQILKKLSQNPSNLHNPFELGETLFLSGNLKEAAICYQEALKRNTTNDANSARDRAWILFQIGNCLRNDDPPAAIQIYGQLITEYPNSTWKEFAETRRALLDWYLKEEPQKLINERKR
jgi:tetratricopeptide (TPR) repeat protein